MRRPSRTVKKLNLVDLTLVSQPVVKFKSVLMLANVLISCQKLHFEIVQCWCTLWRASQVESGTGAIFRPKTAACNTCKRHGSGTVQFSVQVSHQKNPKKIYDTTAKCRIALLPLIYVICPFPSRRDSFLQFLALAAAMPAAQCAHAAAAIKI